MSLLLMEDVGCNLAFVKVTNQNIIEVVTKSPCSTHSPN
jgi:hypothetical protein